MVLLADTLITNLTSNNSNSQTKRNVWSKYCNGPNITDGIDGIDDTFCGTWAKVFCLQSYRLCLYLELCHTYRWALCKLALKAVTNWQTGRRFWSSWWDEKLTALISHICGECVQSWLECVDRRSVHSALGQPVPIWQDTATEKFLSEDSSTVWKRQFHWVTAESMLFGVSDWWNQLSR